MSENWAGKRVLVTGADGFIGSHLTEALVAAGANVRAFCFYNSNTSRGWLDHTDDETAGKIDFRLGDIRDSRFVDSATQGVDIVFHLAALISVPYSYDAADSFVDTNVKGALNVLEAVRRNGCSRMVHTSTSEVYGTPRELPILETHPLQAQSPYAASKVAADKLAEAFHHSHDTPVVTLRPFNTYGPRQSTRAVIPTILTQLLSGRDSVTLGNVEPKRDVTFVSDTVRGFLAAGLARGVEGRTIQLGTGEAPSIRDIFETACTSLSVSASIHQSEERMRPTRSEVMVLQSDPSLARTLLGWESRVTLSDGLSRTAEWLRKNLDQYSTTYAV